MGRRKRTTRKNNVQHILPQINLSLDVVDDDVNEQIRNPTPPRVVIEDHSDEADNHTPFTLEAPLLSEEADSGNESATSFHQVQKRKTNNTGKDDNENHMQKKTRKLIILLDLFFSLLMIYLIVRISYFNNLFNYLINALCFFRIHVNN